MNYLTALLKDGVSTFMSASLPVRMGCIAAVLLAVAAVAAQFAPVWGDATSQQLALNQRVSLGFVNAGKEALAANKLPEAQNAFESAVVADPANAQAYAYLGRAEQKANLFDAARWHCETALKIDPDSVDALGWGGEVDLSLDKNVEQANAKLARLKRLCDDCSQYENLAKAISRFGSKSEQKVDKE